MAEERSGIYVISIVAVVAVVGLVTIFLRGGEAPMMQAEIVPEFDEEGNVIGEAFRLRSLSSKTMEYAVPKKPMMVQPAAAETCVDSDSGDEFATNKGYVQFWDSAARIWVYRADRCTPDGKGVLEQTCPGGDFAGHRVEVRINCPSGTSCVDGKCPGAELI